MMDNSGVNIPDGWSLVPVGDLLAFKNGLNKGKTFFGYGTPIVNYMDVFSHAGLYSANIKGLVNVTNAEKKAFSARKGDVLFTRTSETPEEVGISSVLMEEIDEAVFSGFVLRGRPVSKALSANYAKYCFSSSVVRNQIISSATYTTRALTNGRILSKVLLPLPDDTKEQEAIAEALSDADALIEGLERLIAKKRLIKQGAMQDLLTAKRRLPGFSGDWQNSTLGAQSKMRSGGTPNRARSEYYGGSHAWVSISDMTASRKILSQTKERLSSLGLRNSAAVLFPEGVILFAMYASVGEVCIAGGVVSTSQAILGIEVGPALNGDFAYYWLVLNREKFANMGQQGTQSNLNKALVQCIEISLPSIAEQKAISAVLSDMDTELQALETRLEKARQVKEGMMQNLLTGRIRLV